MRPAEEYRGREQTYLKHFFLEKYLERVAYNIGSFATEFVYVDGFSGPWRSQNEAFDDTSFMIAIKQLRAVREGIRVRGKDLRVRCLFIEKDPDAFKTLQAATSSVTDLEVQALHGSFEDLVPEVSRFIGTSFSLVFIDPTGWTGFALEKIKPVLKLRGEVLVNFMVNHINRFVEDKRPELIATLQSLFGGTVPELGTPSRRDDALASHYAAALKRAGDFKYATFTRIPWPLQDRTYFHLVYCTRAAKGLLEFRSSEKRLFDEQHKVWTEVKQVNRVAKSGQLELLTAAQQQSPEPLSEERDAAVRAAEALVVDVLDARVRVTYEDLRAAALEIPLFWEKDLKELLLTLRAAGKVSIEGMATRERTPKERHMIVRSAPHDDET